MKIIKYYAQFVFLPVIFALEFAIKFVELIKCPVLYSIDAYKEHRRTRPF
jgi:hypothetical protein